MIYSNFLQTITDLLQFSGTHSLEPWICYQLIVSTIDKYAILTYPDFVSGYAGPGRTPASQWPLWTWHTSEQPGGIYRTKIICSLIVYTEMSPVLSPSQPRLVINGYMPGGKMLVIKTIKVCQSLIYTCTYIHISSTGVFNSMFTY